MSDTHAADSLTGREIAVIGMSGRFPGSRNLNEFWQNLRGGVEAVSFFTDEELLASGIEPEQLRHPNYVKAGSLLEDVDLFDASFFGYNAREGEILDPQQRLFLEDAWHALEDAGYAPREYEGSIGVYAGAAWNTYLLSNLTSHRELFFGGGGFQVFIANDKDFMPTRVAYKFNLKGPSLIIQTSCSTSLVAVHMACLSLLNYECDIALVGGVTVKVPQKAGYFYQEGGLASPDGHCRAFDAKAAGTIFGSGVGVVALKRLAEALDDGDNIRAVIKSSAINNDGSAKISYTAPSVEGQAQVIAAAQAMAGFEPETIRYIETHGTGTFLGDPVEVTALTKVFRNSTQKKGFCAIGSVKSNIGHLDAAAGIAGFIKTVLALEHKELPPSINFDAPNPSIDFAETPFYVNSKLAGWHSAGLPRRAAVSSFGVGGTNAHVILEEAPVIERGSRSRPWQLLMLSARTESALEASTQNLASRLREDESISLPDAAYTLQVGRATFRNRRVVACRDRADAIRAIETSDNRRVLTAVDIEDPRNRPVVFMFPGQGSQYVMMGRELYECEATFREHFDNCAGFLKTRCGFDLKSVIYPEDASGVDAAARIDQTSFAQPALFVIEYALSRLWMEWGVKPAAMIGHSIGEYAAACLAGVFSVEEALSLLVSRGRLMQQQPAGRMLAVSLTEDKIAQMLPADISIAALNEPSGSVVSGPLNAIAEFEQELAGREIGFRPLHTSHAFHSSMMEPIRDAFEKEVRKVSLRAPQILFISNLTGTWITPEQATSPAYWVSHLRETVRFSQGITELMSDPDRLFLEVGPGRVLTTLAGRHPNGRNRVLVPSIRHPNEDVSDTRMVLESLGRLWLAGLKLDWNGFYKRERRLRVALPVYPFERQRFWIGPIAHQSGAQQSTAPGLLTLKRPDVSQWFYLPSWKPSPLNDSAAEPKNRWLILADELSITREFAANLAANGRDVITVETGESFRRLSAWHYTIRPGFREDYQLLLQDLREREQLPQAVLHAFSLTASRPVISTAAEFEAFGQSSFYSLLFLLQALAERPQEQFDVTVISNSALETMAADAPVPEKAPMLGLCRTAAQEFTNITTRFVDVEVSDLTSPLDSPVWESLVAEADAGSAELAIAYRRRQRWVQSFEQVHLEVKDRIAPLLEGGVYFVTGGLSGNGLALARYLARAAKARLVLVEDIDSYAVSTDTQDAELGRRLREIESLKALGAEVHFVAADITNPEELQRIWLEGEAMFGSINGVIHAQEPAGEKAFRVLSEASLEECAWHFRAKAHSLYALEKVLKDRKLDFCVFLSSLASALGGIGYGPYAAANLFMDSFVKRSNRTNRSPWLSLDWDLWFNEAGTDQIAEVRGDLSDLAMSAREGEEAFRCAIAARGIDQVLVSTADLSTRIASMQRRLLDLRVRREGSGTASALHPRPPLANLYVPPETDLERRIAAVWQQVLGFESIGVEDNFFELGGDSLIAIQVAASLKQELQIDFPVAKLYQGVTVRALAQILAEDKSDERQRRASQQAERKQAMSRRSQYIERRRSRLREMEG
ncbi:MAG: beta-ketoacyl synthase N-terminal-like domain-containing protein [Blastocatellia bacterium]